MRIMYMLQKIGRSLMIPIAVLPAASILLRFGHMEFSNSLLIQFAQICESGGSAIFDHLPLIFAVGVAIGLTSGDGIAALAAAVGYLVFDNVLKHFHAGTASADELDMGVLGGMMVGMISAAFFEKYQHVNVPKALGFFGGKRFVPLITSISMVLLGVVMGIVWPPVQRIISDVGLWIVSNGNVGVFVYGFMNRLLIPTGLHHIINNIAWFQIGDYVTPAGKVVHGDLYRYFAGDKTAGMFMTGHFPIIMFGLPGAVLAMVKGVHPSNRPIIVPVLLSAGLTSFLTGVTEPIEFSFMFVAPALYLIHACLTGCSMVIMNMLQVKMGFGFSAGFIDFVLNWNLSTKPYWILIVGLAYFFVYYFTFRAFMRFFHFKVPGQADASEEEEGSGQPVKPKEESRAEAVLRHLGGVRNVLSVDACITRLRLLVLEDSLIQEHELKQLGAIGVIRLGKGNVHVVFGTESEHIREQLKPMLVQKKRSIEPMNNGGAL